MAVSRTAVVDANLRQFVENRPPAAVRHDLDSPVVDGSRLTAREAIRLFECQIESRILDLVARDLKNEGQGFYTIGSSGHEGNAAIAAAARPDDPAFLHYRSGGFFLSRAGQVAGQSGAFDVLLGLVSSKDEPIAGGRHKVFGSLALQIPPQTSTIASHLPKAVGCAVALERKARLEGRREDRIVLCTFGDASANHATAQTAFNAASWTAYQHLPVPVLFVCEDNGIGISTRTPDGWIGHQFSARPDLRYFHGDALQLDDVYDAACEAVDFVRETRRPAFLHVKTVRLMGHAGSDVEQTYRTPEEIAAAEALDPLLRTAALLVDHGWVLPQDLLALYEDTWARLAALSKEAVRRPRLTDAQDVVRPLFRHDADEVARSIASADEESRRTVFGGELPEQSDRPRHLAFQINRGLADVLAAYPDAMIFGEDVARKGGVYHVTADLWKRFGNGRVFNTLLDETSILGLALGAGQAGLLPIPEIQYLAYLMNAVDQLRGEAGSLQYFSNGQFANPMVVRIAGLAYQKGFGGHFHNDNGVAAVREIPGVLFGVPAKGDDAVRMLRTMVAAAKTQGRVCVFLEPIALYMTRDLHASGDNLWQTTYPAPGEHLPVDEVGVYGETGKPDLTIATFANGLWMSLRVAKRLEAEGVRTRVIDLRWLQPLPLDALWPHAEASGKLLVVDECRASSGIADTVAADVSERSRGAVVVRRVTSMDTYIPLGEAANLVLVGEKDIEDGARKLLGGGR